VVVVVAVVVVVVAVVVVVVADAGEEIFVHPFSLGDMTEPNRDHDWSVLGRGGGW